MLGLCVVVAVLATFAQATLPKVSYLTPHGDTEFFSVKYVPELRRLEVTAAGKVYNVAFERLKGQPYITSRAKQNHFGLLIFDGDVIKDTASDYFYKRISPSRQALIIYSRQSPTDEVLLKQQLTTVLTLTGILSSDSQSISDLQLADSSVQAILGGNPDFPRCCLVIIDMPSVDRPERTLTGSGFPPTVPKDARPVIEYLTPVRHYGSSFRLQYFAEENAFLFNYELNGVEQQCRLLLTRVTRMQEGQPGVSGINAGRQGVIIIQGPGYTSTSRDTRHIQRAVKTRTAIIFYNPTSDVDVQILAKRLSTVLKTTRVLRAGVITEDNMLNAESEVNKVIAHHFPSSPKGFLLILSPPAGYKPTKKPEQPPNDPNESVEQSPSRHSLQFILN